MNRPRPKKLFATNVERSIRQKVAMKGIHGQKRLKHSQDSRGAATAFSNSLREGTVVIAVRNINLAGVFAENLRKELSSYVYQPLSESSDEYSFLKTLC